MFRKQQLVMSLSVLFALPSLPGKTMPEDMSNSSTCQNKANLGFATFAIILIRTSLYWIPTRETSTRFTKLYNLK